MSESGSFGGGFSGGSDSGGGFDSGSSWPAGTFAGGGFGGAPAFAPANSDSAGAWDAPGDGGAEAGSFGAGFSRRHEASSWLPALEGGALGYLLGRGMRPGPNTVLYQPYSPYPPSPFPGPSPAYSPIGSRTGSPYMSAPVAHTLPSRAWPAPPGPRAQAGRMFRYAMLGAVALAGWLYLVVFASHAIEVREREQHLLSANSWFTTAVVVSPDPGPWWSPKAQQPASFSTVVLALPSRPRSAGFDRFRLGGSGVVVQRYGYQVWPVWLNQGSQVELQHNTQSRLELVVVRGREEMESWKDDPEGSADENHGVLLKRTLVGRGAVHFTARRDGLHFFALANFRGTSATCDLWMDIASAVYDFSASAHKCDLTSDDSELCSVDMPLGNPMYALLATSIGSDPSRPPRYMRVQYSPRLLAYAVLLLLPWLVSMVVAGEQRRGQAHTAQPTEDHPVGPAHAEVASSAAAVAGPSPGVGSSFWHPASRLHDGAYPQASQGGVKAPIPSSWVASAGAAPHDTQPCCGPDVSPGPAPSAPPAPSEPSTRVSENLHEQVTGEFSGSDKTQDFCAICMEANKDAVILDCGHRATCFSCGQLLQSGRAPLCPICRQPIKNIVKVYDV